MARGRLQGGRATRHVAASGDPPPPPLRARGGCPGRAGRFGRRAAPSSVDARRRLRYVARRAWRVVRTGIGTTAGRGAGPSAPATPRMISAARSAARRHAPRRPRRRRPLPSRPAPLCASRSDGRARRLTMVTASPVRQPHWMTPPDAISGHASQPSTQFCSRELGDLPALRRFGRSLRRFGRRRARPTAHSPLVRRPRPHSSSSSSRSGLPAGGGGTTGSSKRKMAPPPGGVPAHTAPPSACATWATIARPSPEPGSPLAAGAR